MNQEDNAEDETYIMSGKEAEVTMTASTLIKRQRQPGSTNAKETDETDRKGQRNGQTYGEGRTLEKG